MHFDKGQIIAIVFVVMSLVTFVAYGIDKRAAKKGSRRIPENTLHLFALFGGWPGALMGQKTFRHKTVKSQFRIVFWMTIAVNLAATTWLLGWW
ncbi:MAG: DUF1294 domain-containing protein [Verrucomicrobiota bacterium]